MYVKDVKVKEGKCNYYMIGNQIVYDEEMSRMFPSTTVLTPEMYQEKLRQSTLTGKEFVLVDGSMLKKVMSDGELFSTYASTQKPTVPDNLTTDKERKCQMQYAPPIEPHR